MRPVASCALVAVASLAVASGGNGAIVTQSNVILSTQVETWSLNPASFAGDASTLSIASDPFAQANLAQQVNGEIDIFGFAAANVTFAGVVPGVGWTTPGISMQAVGSASAQAQVAFVDPFQSISMSAASLDYTVRLLFSVQTTVTYSATLFEAGFAFFDVGPGGVTGQEVFISHEAYFVGDALIVQPQSVVVAPGEYILRSTLGVSANAVGTDGPVTVSSSGFLNAAISFAPIPAPGVWALGIVATLAPRRRR